VKRNELTLTRCFCLQTYKILDTITWVEVNEVSNSLDTLFDPDNCTDTAKSIDWSIDGKWVAMGTASGGIHVMPTQKWQSISPLKLEI